MEIMMIKAGNITINSAFVASMSWDRRHYVNGPGDSILVIRMHDGTEHRVKHEPHFLDGADAYQIEKAISEAKS